MSERWEIGPKFSDYLKMNLRMVKTCYIAVAATTLTMWMGWYMAVLPGYWLIRAYIQLYSVSLYHKEAYLYQSVPVTAFETVMAKLIVGTFGMLIPVTAYVINWAIFGNGTVFKGTALTAAIVTVFLGVLLINEAFLFGMSAGNKMRGNRDKKPKGGVVILAAGVIITVMCLITWIIKKMTFLTVLNQNLILMVIAAVGTAVMFIINVRSIAKSYSI